MRSLEREVLHLCEAGEKGCLVTLIRSSGSVPMSRHAKMLVRADGSTQGTVGGGCLEAEVWHHARDVIHTGAARCVRYALNQEDVLESGLVCGGSVEFFLEPLGGPAMAEVYRQVVSIQEGRERAVLATAVESDPGIAVRPGDRLLVRADGWRVGQFGDPMLQAAVLAEVPRVLREETPRLGIFVAGEPGLVSTMDATAPSRARVFLEPIVPIPTLYIFGGGHVGFYTAQVAAMVGMRIVVIDDRPAFANRERFPQADETIVADFAQVFDQILLDESAYVVIVTRGHQHDETVLEHALQTPARYIGMIGSRHKVRQTFQRLRQRGVSEEALARVHAPIGLPIHADTPEEIAVSILAEIIAVRRAGTR